MGKFKRQLKKKNREMNDPEKLAILKKAYEEHMQSLTQDQYDLYLECSVEEVKKRCYLIPGYTVKTRYL